MFKVQNLNQNTSVNTAKKIIKPAVITSVSLAAIAGGALAFYFILPQMLPSQMSVLTSPATFWRPASIDVYTVLAQSADTIMRNAIILAVAGAVLGLGAYGLSTQIKKIFNFVKQALEKRLLEGNEKETSEEVSSLKKNARNLLHFINTSKEYIDYVGKSKLGRLIKMAAIIGTFTTGVVFLSLASYYFAYLVQNSAIQGGAYAVSGHCLKLALTGLVAGGALSSVGAVWLCKSIFPKKREKTVEIAPQNDSLPYMIARDPSLSESEAD